MSPGRVTLLSDFGTVDGYAAAMAGVIAAAHPTALLDHASHDIPPGDVLAAALTLARYAFLYPPGTIHLVVVDPGVGTQRRAVAARIDGRLFVAPDNGVLTRVLARGQEGEPRPEPTPEPASTPEPEPAVIVALDPHLVTDGALASATFHGRDIFAPAAARLARGEAMESLGTVAVDPVLLPLPRPERTAATIRGEVIQVDHFGNLITNIPASWLAGGNHSVPLVRVEGVAVGGPRRTYGDAEVGGLVALVGSLELLEVSVRDGSAADRLGAGRGAGVTVDLAGR